MAFASKLRHRSRAGRADGQATIEFALIVPLIALAIFALIQVALIAYSQLAVTHIAREVARSLVVDPEADIGQITSRLGLIEADGLDISVSYERHPTLDLDFVLVAVSYEVPPISRLFSGVMMDFRVQVQVKMLVEG